MRKERQDEAIQSYLESDGKSIIYAAPRFGKIKVAIEIMKKKMFTNPLIVAPRKDIQKGWLDDFKKWEWKGKPTFSTFASIKKVPTLGTLPYDFLIIDEPHELSIPQQKALRPLVDKLPTLGLTGTMTGKTAEELFDNLLLDTCYKYTIDMAVEEGILADYNIYIHRVSLDNKDFVYKSAKGKRYTEKGYYELFQYIRRNARDKRFIDLRLINILQNSTSKLKKTRELLGKFHNKRVLVFCGVTKIADKLGIPAYHSLSREKEIFNSFCKGEKYDQIATIKMMQAGITITPINMGIINYTSGNPEDAAQKICRFLGFEYDNPEKKAEIHIVCSDELFEIERMKTALLFFDKSKIHVIN